MPNDEGITPLHNAVCAGHHHIVKFLLDFGVNVNAADSDGWSVPSISLSIMLQTNEGTLASEGLEGVWGMNTLCYRCGCLAERRQ